MSDNHKEDAASIAQMLYKDLMRGKSVGDCLDLANVKAIAVEYIQTLQACCSSCDILHSMEQQNMVERKQREYLLLEHPSMYD
jgi:hypothetical protein